MVEPFSECEIVELGIQIEKNGMDFYNELAERSTDPKVKELFAFLAGEEEKHMAVFKDILSAAKECSYEPREAYPEDYFSYMNSLASQYIFTKKGKGAEIAEKVKSDIEGMELAIKAEEDSIDFYEGMKKAVPGEKHKMLDEVIRQEKDHWKQLSDLKKTLRS